MKVLLLNRFYLFFFCLCSSFNLYLQAIQNFEEYVQDFVLETKHIHIPGYPHAFNPSIIRWQGSLLLSFRHIPYPYAVTAHLKSIIGLIWLDEGFNPVGKVHLLDTTCGQYIMPMRSEDARLITVNDELWMVYSESRKNIINFLGFGGDRVYLAKLDWNKENFTIQHVECLSDFEGENPKRRERNWVPFEYQKQLLLSYSLVPHKVLNPLIGSGKCETLALTKGMTSWKWGELRGGTPALIDNHQYLAFFHSSKEMTTPYSNNQKTLHYFMGAYTFSSQPPFEITQISPYPIVAEGFYEGNIYQPYWKPVNVVFPSGLILDEQYIWISYGKHDHEAWIAKLDKQALLKSLFPVRNFYEK